MDYREFNGKKRSSFGYFMSSLLGAVIGGFLLLTFGPAALFAKLQPQTPETPTVPQTQQIQQVTETKSGSVTQAVNKVIPSVVSITTTTVQRTSFSRSKKVQGVGSGIIIDSSGYILTNNHVAGMDAKSISVSLYDGREFSGTPVWTDPILDLSIIKIDASGIPIASLGDSRKVKIGEDAIAIGNPLGLTFQRTVTAGIISAVNRTVEIEKGVFMEDLIQTDASINPGNSGGPLVNIGGEVIAVNTVKVSTAEGIGFAVPINIVKPVIESIKRTGTFTAPVIGIKGFDKELASFYNYKVDAGIYIIETVPGSPAANAGIREGDVILSINNKNTNTLIELKEALYTAGVGSTVTVRYKSQLGAIKDVNVTLEASS